MKPTIGRIVHYRTTKDDRTVLGNTGGWEASLLPAIITATHSDTCVNIQVFADGRQNLWKTSVNEGDGEGQWSWPVKE